MTGLSKRTKLENQEGCQITLHNDCQTSLHDNDRGRVLMSVSLTLCIVKVSNRLQ